jgi:hypothetical protein
MKLLISPAICGLLCFAATSTGAATPPPVKPPAKGAFDKTAPPQDAYGVFSFDKAKAEADKKKRPLVFLLTEERADEAASEKAATNRSYWTFWEDAVVVVLRASTAGDWSRLPDAAQKAVKSPDLGKEYPRLVGFDQAGETPLLGMKAAQIVADDEKALDKIAKSLKSANKTKTASVEFPPPSLAEAAKPAPAAPPAAKPGAPPAAPATPAPAVPPPAAVPAVILIKGAAPENWTNVEGRTIQATLAEAGADKVVFLMPNGGRVDYDLAKLSDASKKRVEELKAASTPH